MSLQWFLSREIPADTAAIGQQVLAVENVYRQIGDRFNDLFPEERVFANLYDRQGRGALPPLLAGVVTVFQILEQVPDRVAAQFVASRIDWKYALHLPLGYAGFHFTDLYAFRQRLLSQGQERQLFDQLLLKLKEAHLIPKRGKMRTDSTHVLAVVERLSQLELVAESLRLALLAVFAAAPGWSEQALPESFRQRYSQRLNLYGLSDHQTQAQLLEVGREAFWFLGQVERWGAVELQHLPAVETLRQVLAQQFPQGPGKPPLANRPSGGEVIESPHEPQARFGTKRGKSWIGYKAQVTETCEQAYPHLLMDLEPTGALENDSPQLPQIQARLKAQETLPNEHQVDQGYLSGENLVESAKLGINLLGLPLADTQGPPGFRQADFAIDEAARQATCPDEQTSRVWSQRRTGQIQIRFDAQRCQPCRFFGVCTQSPQGRSLTLHPHRLALIQRRAEAKTPAFLEKLHLRAGIEGTISELVRSYGLRRARYRGQAKLRLQMAFTAVAINLRRLVRWWNQPSAQLTPAG